MVTNKMIQSELLQLASEYQNAGFKKLASRLTVHADLFKDEEKRIKADSPLVENPPAPAPEGMDEDEEDAEDEGEDTGDDENTEEGEEDAEGKDNEDDEDEDEEEEDSMEEMDEDIAMRDACTKIFRAAKKISTHPSPNVRSLSQRLLKVERLIRATL